MAFADLTLSEQVAVVNAKFNRMFEIMLAVCTVQSKIVTGLNVHLGTPGNIHPAFFTSAGEPTDAGIPWIPDPLAADDDARK